MVVSVNWCKGWEEGNPEKRGKKCSFFSFLKGKKAGEETLTTANRYLDLSPSFVPNTDTTIMSTYQQLIDEAAAVGL